MKRQTLHHDLLMRGIKLVDIAYISLLYFTASFACAKATDRAFGPVTLETEKQKSLARRTVEAVGAVALFGVVFYLIRNVVERIPFPLDGYQGFSHKLVSELGPSSSVFSLIYLYFSQFLRNKLTFYYSLV